MSWEDQGRQWHGWFGTGTNGGPSGPELVGAVARVAEASLPGGLRAGFGRYLAEGGAEELGEALPAWGMASGLRAGAFRRVAVGGVLGDRAAGSLQEAGVAYAAGDTSGAGVALAAAIAAEGGARWRYGLTYARDVAVYSVVNGRLGSDGGPGVAVPVRQVVPRLPFSGPLPDVFIPGTRDNDAFTRGTEAGLRALVDAFRRMFQSAAGDDGEETPPPKVSPSAGTGTPDPEGDPDERPTGRGNGRGKDLSAAAEQELPTGMTRAEFGKLAGFRDLREVLEGASTEPTKEVVEAMKAKVSRAAIEAWMKVYAEAPKQPVAIHRLETLKNILKAY